MVRFHQRTNISHESVSVTPGMRSDQQQQKIHGHQTMEQTKETCDGSDSDSGT